MGNLFDELKKAKLIDKKKAKQLAHEQRVEKSKKGGDRALDAEASAKAAEREARIAEERRKDRERERERQVAERARQELLEVRQLVESRAIEDARGSRRWHFALPSGALPFVPVHERAARRLEAGEIAIVLDPSVAYPRYVLLPRDVAQKLEAKVPGSLCYMAGA